MSSHAYIQHLLSSESLKTSHHAVIMQNAPGVTFIMKEMVKHLVNLLFVNALFIFLIRKRMKSGAEYNIKLIGQPTNYFKISAAVIGISSTVIAILIVIVFNQNVMIVIAAVFISLGTGRQTFASALDVVTNHQFIMPKSKVDYYDGSDVYLKIPSQLLSIFEVGKQNKW
jgi:hypothetical protein